MTLGNPSVSTKWGNFDKEMVSDLRETLEDAKLDKRSDEVTNWRGQEVVAMFGWYLVEYVEGELAKRNTRGL